MYLSLVNRIKTRIKNIFINGLQENEKFWKRHHLEKQTLLQHTRAAWKLLWFIHWMWDVLNDNMLLIIWDKSHVASCLNTGFICERLYSYLWAIFTHCSLVSPFSLPKSMKLCWSFKNNILAIQVFDMFMCPISSIYFIQRNVNDKFERLSEIKSTEILNVEFLILSWRNQHGIKLVKHFNTKRYNSLGYSPNFTIWHLLKHNSYFSINVKKTWHFCTSIDA